MSTPKYPSDFEIRMLVSSMWRHGLNLELNNIAACMASNQRVERTPEYTQFIHTRLKAMVRNGDLRRARFLPGRPFYQPA
jgi:hypothetical protein